ncbi:DNA polymerase III subunit gamma/tau [Candidatus Tachikawaea gelatinosa]|uniref:DNA polymerase III subunit gamma/tau n=1 Tax=Candidatus Tachikawaea gelatinosa TaxID=1410383 RepID=A0A090AR48_9ENTR|nr:DNA polymerase III subunit gamma/tau [Candidatus Tachikawaea gelatinosa]BAP58832.1 DNA polymerase III tau and gamma subunits [Candidatus Tachikawaea gelatinosa]
MIYQVLARKYRPQTFSEINGQTHIITALKNALSLNRLHHAYLFSGTRGIGKTTIARVLAKGLNCKKKITDNPCRKCQHCLDIENGTSIDLIEIDAASQSKVEDIRNVLDNIQYYPLHCRFKIYLIDEVHMLSRYSFNALLKTLEEPPNHVKFILATTDPNKLPTTIISRCLHFYLQKLTINEITKKLQDIVNKEKIKTELNSLTLIAKSSDGSMRDALSLTDQAIALGNGKINFIDLKYILGIIDEKYSLLIFESLVKGNIKKIMCLLDDIEKNGQLCENLLIEILSWIHHIAILQILPDSLPEEKKKYLDILNNLAISVSPSDIQLYYQIFLLGRKDFYYAPCNRTGIEMIILKAIAFHPKVTESYKTIQS